jgi:zinc transport system ATP-binding protein
MNKYLKEFNIENKTNNTLITLNNIFVYYKDFCALEDVNLTINRNDYIGIIGPNGGGKTTLLKTLIGTINPTKGSIQMVKDVSIGYVPQFNTFNTDFPISVKEVILNGTLPSKLKLFHKYKKSDYLLVDNIIDTLHLNDLKSKSINELSGGQIQKVLIARALVSQPNILLLDEPTASLDVDAKKDIYNLLNSLSEKITVIVVSHDLSIVKQSVRTLACLNKTMHVHKNSEDLDLNHFEALFTQLF